MTGELVNPNSGGRIGTESSLSSWAGPYVTDMLGRGKALADQPYNAYTGPLSAGNSTLQNTAFSGLGNLTLPTTSIPYAASSFTDSGIAQSYMHPYTKQVIDPHIAEATRQSQIFGNQNAAQAVQAGAFGGSRGALMDAEAQRNLLRQLSDITGQGYHSAYESGRQQFNTEQDRLMNVGQNDRRYGLDLTNAQMNAGNVQRGILSEGIAADMGQFQDERDDPYKKVQYMQSMLQGLPLATQNYSYQQASPWSEFSGAASGIGSFLDNLLASWGKPRTLDTRDG